MRRRKEWVRITVELEDDKWKMSSGFELELLRKRKELSENILSDLKEEERILQDDIRYWEADIEKMRGEEDELRDKVCGMTSEDEEDEYQEYLKDLEYFEYLEEEEEEQNRKKEEEEYLEYLGYLEENEEEEEKESENSPQCATCLAQKSEEQNGEEEASEEEYPEEEESSRCDSSE